MLHRFGIFTFDSETRELTRGGLPVRLEPQPAIVLALLIDKAGAVVTRDDLRRTVWGDTFVDFDRGLNYAIGQIRTALGDSATSPRFVRTVPKVGYEFIAPVESFVERASRPARDLQAPPLRPRKKLTTSILVTSAALLLALAAWLLARPAQPPVIAVARFDNETGSPDFDRVADALTDLTVADLTDAAGPHYGVIGNAAILRPPRPARDLAAIASSLHASYVVLGQVQRSGVQIRVLAHLIRMPQQTHLWVVRADRNDINGLESGLAHRIAAEFLQHLDSSPLPRTR